MSYISFENFVAIIKKKNDYKNKVEDVNPGNYDEFVIIWVTIGMRCVSMIISPPGFSATNVYVFVFDCIMSCCCLYVMYASLYFPMVTYVFTHKIV